MEVRDYLRIARRRWFLILACLAMAVGLAALFTFRATPLYSSTAQLFISTPGGSSAEAYQGSLFSQQRVTSYADLASNRQVAEQVLKQVPSDLTPTELAAKVSATAVPETVILQISVSDADPEVAQKYTQAYAQVMSTVIADLEKPAKGGPAPIKATVSENASLPTSPYSPQPLRNLGLAAVLGLLLGFGLAVLREVLDTSIKNAGDVSTVADVPVMGTIALDSTAPKKPLITEIAAHAPRAEAFRVLRTNLQFVDVDNPNKVFTISSSIPSEGKTSTALNLAIALAQAGSRTLLIDADLRRPRVHERLGLEGAVGLTTALVGRIKVHDAIQKHAPSGLDFLASGAMPPNPAELLQSHAMAEMLKTLSDEYDVIILDAPPLLPVTDAALLAAQSDGALVVVRHGHTNRDQLALSVERLRAVDARPLGVVMNMVPVRRRGGSYGYGYGYGPDVTAGKRKRSRREPPPEALPELD